MDILKQHRDWLKNYEGLKYGIGEEGHYKKGHEWTKTKYKDKFWNPSINLIGELKNKLKIEFDDDNAKENLETTRNKLVKHGWKFIRSTHHGGCDYLWVEFKRDLKDKEKESFLKWLSPTDATIDLNFASSKKVFPVMYAVHWKHSYHREMPMETHEGKLIDFDSLGLSKSKSSSSDFNYKTYTKPAAIFEKKAQAEEFYKRQPFFYDDAGLWWMWHKSEYYYKRMTDDINILNRIEKEVGVNTIKPSDKTEILNALKQVGRKKIPKPIKPTWVQFKNEIFDIKTGETLEPNPEYFVTNPIPYQLHQSKFMNTPVMDRIFEEWVGKDHIKTLYEIVSYCLLPDYPMNRLFCFIGAGMNGKSKFLELLTKFIGDENCTTTELDTLLTSRFEITRLHRKLVCLMGETDFSEISKTSILKKLTGGDMIGFEYKNKNPFHDKNYAKIIIATNNLPTTTDKTIGFYRRWLIIDFPNQFSEQKDILGDIPEEEYKSLALKCCFILKGLLDERKFHNEGTIQDRMERYEAKSDFLQKFIEDFTEEDPEGYITKNDFFKKFVSWCKEQRHRQMSETSLGIKLKGKGFESGKKYFTWMNDGRGGEARVLLGVKWKE